jgi:dienelactone hydrolase
MPSAALTPRRLAFFFCFALLLLSACRGAQASLPPTSTALGAPTQVAQQPAATHTPTRVPSATPSATPSVTLTPTPTATPTITPSPTPTLHPMTILALRQGSYPGSEIGTVAELERGVNYRRYRVSYQSEGLKIYALLTIPNAAAPEGGYPGIVFNHGFIPPAQYRTTERYLAYVDWLARAGYVVFRIDYRGHDQSEGQPTGAYAHPGYTVDVLNAAAALRAHPLVNPEKVGMWGHSMGGYLTLRAMVVDPEIRAGVIWAGVVGSYPDLINHWRPGRPTPTPNPLATPGGGSWRWGWAALYGTPDENPAFWDAISSNTYVADLGGPIQLHHGTADESVPLILSQLLAEDIRAVGGQVEFYEYEGDNHNLAGFFSAAMTRTIAFYDRHLKAADD